MLVSGLESCNVNPYDLALRTKEKSTNGNSLFAYMNASKDNAKAGTAVAYMNANSAAGKSSSGSASGSSTVCVA